MELGPTDEGTKNGHMAKDCPVKVNIRKFNDVHNHWVHGACDEQPADLKDLDEYKRNAEIFYTDGTRGLRNFYSPRNYDEHADAVDHYDKGFLRLLCSVDSEDFILVNLAHTYAVDVKKGWK